MSQKLIRSLYESRLKAWAEARNPALQIACENAQFNPPAGTYLAVFQLPADTTSADLAGGLRNRTGVFQVNIVCATGNGPGEGQGIAAELDALFPNNLRLTSGQFTVQSVTPTRERQPVSADNRFTVPVDLQYRSDST